MVRIKVCTQGLVAFTLCKYLSFKIGLKNAVVKDEIKLTVETFRTTASNGQVKLIMGKTGLGLSGHDPDIGSWSIIKSEEKCTNEYEEIWSGTSKASKIASNIESGDFIIVNDTEKRTQFYTHVRKNIPICGIEAHETDYDDIYVIFLTSKNHGISLKTVTPLNANLLQTIESSTTFLHHSFAKSVNELINDMEYNECMQKKNQLEAELIIAGQLSSANLLNQENGYTVQTRGQILQITQCPEVLVSIRNTNLCYEDLPVSFNGKNAYIDSITNILKEDSNEIECNPALCSIFKIEGQYYKQCPSFEIVSDIEIIKPNSTKFRRLDETPPIQGNVFGTKPSDFYRAIMFPHKREKANRQLVDGVLSMDKEKSGAKSSDYETVSKNWLFDHFNKIGQNMFEYIMWGASIILTLYVGFKILVAGGMWFISVVCHILAYGFEKRTKDSSMKIFNFILGTIMTAFKEFKIKKAWTDYRQNRKKTSKSNDKDLESQLSDEKDLESQLSDDGHLSD